MRQSMAFTELSSELMLGRVEVGVRGTVYETPGGMVPMMTSPVLVNEAGAEALGTSVRLLDCTMLLMGEPRVCVITESPELNGLDISVGDDSAGVPGTCVGDGAAVDT